MPAYPVTAAALFARSPPPAALTIPNPPYHHRLRDKHECSEGLRARSGRGQQDECIFTLSSQGHVTDDERGRLQAWNRKYCLPFDIPCILRNEYENERRTATRDDFAAVTDDLLYVKEQLSVAHKATTGCYNTCVSLKQIDALVYRL
jgi:hypothetical protein